MAFPRDPDLPPSPKPRYRSTYQYLGFDDLSEETLRIFSPFEIAVRLFDYSHLEPLLAAHIYVASAKGQTPFHPVGTIRAQAYACEPVARLPRHRPAG